LHFRGEWPAGMRITRDDGLVDAEQAAQLCGVKPGTIRQWVHRGLLKKAGLDERGRSLFDPVALQKAEYATRERARRVVFRRVA
jgi:predicted site-specific integrase-resolvase